MQSEPQRDRKLKGANRSMKIAFSLFGVLLVAVVLICLALKMLFGVHFDLGVQECKHIHLPRINSNRLLWA